MHLRLSVGVIKLLLEKVLVVIYGYLAITLQLLAIGTPSIIDHGLWLLTMGV